MSYDALRIIRRLSRVLLLPLSAGLTCNGLALAAIVASREHVARGGEWLVAGRTRRVELIRARPSL
jgi:hypothetical protein